jgi:glycosyltransferase involved in cell wall biosynthesis
LRIVHICVASSQPMLSAFGGAIQRRILELSKVQARRGHDVTAFSVGPVERQRRVEGVSVRFVRCVSPMPLAHMEYLARVAIAIRRGPRPDVINLHSQPEGLVLAKALRCPAVLFYDNYFFRRTGGRGWRHKGYQRLLRSFDRLLPCSEYCLERSVEYWNLNAADATVQYNGVNLEQFKPDRPAGQAQRKRLGIDGPVVLYVGRVNEQKGTDLLIESISLLRQSGGEATLAVAGPISQFGERSDPDEESSWARRISDVGGIYLGAVPESQLASVYNMADVFAMPTRALEMFGMAAVEAQACGIPVVASDLGGLRETVPETSGARFPVGNADALATQVQGLLDDDDLLRRCSEAAIANAARFDWERVTSDLDAVYAKVGIDA